MPPAMQMEKPPMPPDVQAQMGGGGGGQPFGGLGGMMAEKGAGDPLKTAIDMTEKLWSNVVKAKPKLGAYVARAMAILKAGMEESAQEKPGGGPPAENGGAVPKAPDAGAGMPA